MVYRLLLALCLSINLGLAAHFGDPMKLSEAECEEVIYCPPGTTPTSIVALLGNPSYWSGKAIRVFGWITYDSHGSTLYMSTEHCEGDHTEYGIGVRLDRLPEAAQFLIAQEMCQPVRVQGIYEPTKSREPVPGVLKYRDFWPGIVDAEYLSVEDDDT